MKTYLIILSKAMFAACKVDDKSNKVFPIIDANAILYNNNLPVDGCAEHISLIDSKKSCSHARQANHYSSI